MGKYDFDKIVDRRGSGSYKWDRLERNFGRADLLPYWVADMDFETPDFIVDALKERMEHPVFGYTWDPLDYWPSVMDWIRDRHQWETQREWFSYIPGIVKGLGMVINVFVKPDEKVIIQPPVYHPFRLTPQGNGREVVFNPLKANEDGTYCMDFENLEQVVDEKCKLFVLCNPHNPGGVVWDRETLIRIAEFCKKRGILVVSDEIHCDMALFGHKHIPFASVCEDAAQNSITFGAPSKTFNIAGIVSSYAIIPNKEIREKFFGWLNANEFGEANLFAPIATVAAFRNGEPWREEMVKYIEGNVLFVEEYLAKNIPAIKAVRPQASYLLWLDCRGLGLGHDALVDLFVNKAHLALNDGAMFGPGGEGFMRFNLGCPRSALKTALDNLAKAING